jgi:hypothetical protein
MLDFPPNATITGKPYQMFGEPSFWKCVFLKHNGRCMTKFKIWIKRVGIIGFLFFLIKGLVWLALFFGVGTLFTR